MSDSTRPVTTFWDRNSARRKKATDGGDDGSILTQSETERVIEAFLKGHGPATVAEMKHAVDWATEAKLDAEMLRMVLGGEVWLDHGERGIVFVLPTRAGNGAPR